MKALAIPPAVGGPDEIEFARDQRVRFKSPAVPRLVRDLALMWLQVAAGVALFAVHPTFWTWLTAVFVIGGGQHGISMVAHEAVHWLLWPSSRRVNDWVGSIFFAGPVLLPYTIYRERHLAHHRLVSRVDDTKSLYRHDMTRARFFVEAARSLSGLDYIVQVLDVLWRGLGRPDQRDTVEFGSRLPRDLLPMATAQGALFLAFLAIDPRWHGIPTYYLLLWLVPLTTTGFWFSKLRSCVEHRPLCSEAGPNPAYFLGTSTPMLRSVRATPLERLFLSKINFHYHAEHHLWPWISYQHLPEASAVLWRGRTGSTQIGNRVARMAESYSTVIRSFVLGR